MNDQRSSRKLTFKDLQQVEINVTAENEPENSASLETSENYFSDEDSVDIDYAAESSVTSDNSSDISYDGSESSSKYNKLNLKPVAEVADRFGVSHPATAAIVTTTLQVVGLITQSDQSLVVDEHKVKRSRDKLRQELSSQKVQDFIGLYFDGRKDKTLHIEKGADSVYRSKSKREEHVSLIGEPGKIYIESIIRFDRWTNNRTIRFLRPHWQFYEKLNQFTNS